MVCNHIAKKAVTPSFFVELRPFDLKYAGVTVIFLMKLEQWLICKAYYRKTGEVRMKPSLPFCRAAKNLLKLPKSQKVQILELRPLSLARQYYARIL